MTVCSRCGINRVPLVARVLVTEMTREHDLRALGFSWYQMGYWLCADCARSLAEFLRDGGWQFTPSEKAATHDTTERAPRGDAGYYGPG
jgi:hypothetical protein